MPQVFLSSQPACQLQITLKLNNIMYANDCNFLLLTLLEKLWVESKRIPAIFYEEFTFIALTRNYDLRKRTIILFQGIQLKKLMQLKCRIYLVRNFYLVFKIQKLLRVISTKIRMQVLVFTDSLMIENIGLVTSLVPKHSCLSLDLWNLYLISLKCWIEL